MDGKPDISFWGFVNLNENARDDVLDCLRESLVPEPAPVVIEDPEPEPEPEPVVAFEHADEPLIAPSTVVRITPEDLYEPEPAPAVAQPVQEPAVPIVAKKRRVPLWTLPVAVAIVAAVAAPLMWPKQSPSAEPAPAQSRSKRLSRWP